MPESKDRAHAQEWGGMQVLANLVAFLHLAYFAFVVLGFCGIVIGGFRHWRWVRNSWFRIFHLLAIYIVLAEDVISLVCPLNVVESRLRKAATVPESVVGRVLDRLLYHTIYGRPLDAIYWSLGIASLALLLLVPPDFLRRSRR
jgi:Protein of Unknown function (DUF2784)